MTPLFVLLSLILFSVLCLQDDLAVFAFSTITIPSKSSSKPLQPSCNKLCCRDEKDYNSFMKRMKSRHSNRLICHQLYQTTAGGDNNDLLDDDEERKATLFQFLLRDLEIEGVPLLGCDADQAHTFQAAVWTVMAQLSEKEEQEKACLVLEKIPVQALRTFVDDFVVLKTQRNLMEYLPELERFSVSLVGKGIGPAIIIEAEALSQEQKQKCAKMKESLTSITSQPITTEDELKWTAAMKMFVDRFISEKNICPYTNNNIAAPTGLEERGVQPGPIGYRFVGSSDDVCDALSAFWNCVCELLSLPEDQLGSTILCFPPIPNDGPTNNNKENIHDRFSVVAELMSRSLFLYRGEDVLELIHMHPFYDRDLIQPKEKPAHGHLPPTSWLRAMLKASGKSDAAETLTDEQLTLQNYQRRSPLPAVVIKRVSHLDAAITPESGMVQLDIGDGRLELASGLPTYSKNVIRMAEEGAEALQAALDKEIALAK